LASNLKEEHEEDGFFPMFCGLYPNEDDQLEEEEPTYDIADYEEVDEGLSGEVSNYKEKEIEYVDFLGVEGILNSPNNDVDEFYTNGENYMFIRETTANPFLSIFMARGREKGVREIRQIQSIAKWCVGLSRQISRYYDDEKRHTYFGMLSCFGLKEGLVE
jgi:hypothetical protein